MDAEDPEPDSGTGMPASIEAAWGLRERPHKGPRPSLSQDRIVEAAIQIAQAEGIAAVSMGKVAAKLGASTMSLYRHVSGKDELLALMVDAAYGAPPAPSTPDEGWREGLSRWAWAFRTCMQRHPWAVLLPIPGLPARPNEVAWFEDGLNSLRDTDLAEAEKASVIMLVSGYVRNVATTEADITAAVQASGKTPDDWMAAYARLFVKIAETRHFPALSKFVAAGVFDTFDPPDDEFIFGLDRILDGIEALITKRTPANP
jgi:AcrR family transcriptional regulator